MAFSFEYQLPTPDDFANELLGLDNFNQRLEVEDRWDLFYRNYLRDIIAFQQRHLISANVDGCTVFNPFASGEIMSMLAFFPECKYYVVTGDQQIRIGYQTEVNKLPLNQIREQLFILLSAPRVYYQETPRWNDFTTSAIAQLKAMGSKILSIMPIFLYSTGSIGLEPSAAAVPGIQIIFIFEGRPAQAVTFWPEGAGQFATIKYLEQQQNLITLVRESKFELFWPQYQHLARAIVKYSRHVVHDESGVPFRYFDLDDWHIKHFGVYFRLAHDHPYSQYFQDDLFASFNRNDASTLSFDLSFQPYLKTLTLMMQKDMSNQ